MGIFQKNHQPEHDEDAVSQSDPSGPSGPSGTRIEIEIDGDRDGDKANVTSISHLTGCPLPARLSCSGHADASTSTE